MYAPSIQSRLPGDISAYSTHRRSANYLYLIIITPTLMNAINLHRCKTQW